MQDDYNIIDAHFPEVKSIQTQKKPWLVLVGFVPAVATLGAALDIWSGNVAMGLLIGMALVCLYIGVNAKARRFSSIFVVTALAGVVGVALALAVANLNVWLSLACVLITGLSIVALYKIEMRGWNYEN